MVLGIRNDPYLSFNFLVEIEGLVIGGFSEVGGLQAEIVTQDYQEGGQNEYVHKLAGPVRYPSNLIFKRGLTIIDPLWYWYQTTMQGLIERKNGAIVLLDEQHIPVKWWIFKHAYPIKWIGPQLNASSNTVAVETLELVHLGLTLIG